MGALRGSSLPTQSTTGTPAGRERAPMSQSRGKPSASMYRTSAAPRRRQAADVAELVTSVTAAFRIVLRLRLFSFSIAPVDAVLSISNGQPRPKYCR
jgi:hypothetical protein